MQQLPTKPTKTLSSQIQQLKEEWAKQDPFFYNADGFQKFLQERMPKIIKEEEKEGKRKWDLFMSMWERPVVYDAMGRGWEDTLPKWIHGAIVLERLLQVMAGESEVATDAEVIAHLYTASLARPIPSEFVNIYAHLIIECMERHRPFGKGKGDYAEIQKELGADRPLTEYELRELNQLKRQLWNAGMRASEQMRRERRRREKNLLE